MPHDASANMECPFFNAPERAECQDMARLENLDHALSHCCGHYKSCALFWLQVQARRRQRQAERAGVETSLAG